ncbi:MAG TPA: tetratricopeptide repeat protein, partial [Ktedonobacteraceae bacterium]|nr:tetratricopeptide repeat protein [Ktedonobacteraceae bacterium]
MDRAPVGALQADQTRVLKIGDAIERELKAGQSDVYTIALSAGYFVDIVANQHGIDVVVTLIGPDGNKLLDVDSPNGTEGPEPLLFVSETTGLYRIQVSSLEKDAVPGRYEIRVQELRLATAEDRTRITNLRKQAELQRLEGEVVAEIRPLLVEGERLNLAGNYDAAIPLVERALAISEQKLGANHKIVGNCLNNLGELYGEKKAYERAEQLYLRALPLLENGFGPEHAKVAILLSNIGALYFEKGEYARAEPFLQRAVAIVDKLPPSEPAIVGILGNLAELYQEKGDYVAAEPLYLRALRAGEKTLGLQHPYVINLLGNLGVYYLHTGDYRKSEEIIKSAMASEERLFGAEHPIVARSLNNLAQLYFDLHDFTKAETYYERALAIFRKYVKPEDPRVGILLGNLADVHRMNNDATGAEKLYLESIDVLEKAFGSGHPEIAKKLNNLGSLYDENGEYDKAEKAYQAALSIVRKTKGTKDPDIALILSNLATMYLAKGDISRAITSEKEAFEIREYNLTLVLAAGSEEQKRLFISAYYPEIEGAVSFHLKSAPDNLQAARIALTVLLQRKGRVLDIVTDQTSGLRRHLSSGDQALLNQLIGARSQLATLVYRGLNDMQPSDYQAQLTKLEAETQRLGSLVSSRSHEVSTQSEPVTIEKVQRLIPLNTALVEFVWYEPFDPKAKILQSYGNPRYAAYVLKHDGDPSWVDLGDASVINGEVSKLRTALRDPEHENDIKPVAQVLEERVMRPVRKLLGDTRSVLLSPDNALNPVPFAALVDEHGHFLVEQYSFTYLTSGRDLLRLQNHAPVREPALVMADPLFDLEGSKTTVDSQSVVSKGRLLRKFDQRFTPLKGTSSEGNEIARILGVKPLLGASATEGRLKQTRGPSILHIATHGFFLADPERQNTNLRQVESFGANHTALFAGPELENSLLRSGIALAGANQLQGGDGEDGVLTAFEASGLDLWGTKLVVLSAC